MGTVALAEGFQGKAKPAFVNSCLCATQDQRSSTSDSYLLLYVHMLFILFNSPFKCAWSPFDSQQLLLATFILQQGVI